MLDRCLTSNLFRWGALTLFAASVFLLTFVVPGPFPAPYRIDLDVYRTGAQVFLNGGDLYGALPRLAHGTRLPFTYPPIAAALFAVLVSMPLWLGSLLFTLASIACVAITLQLVLRQTCDRSSAQLWLLVVAAMSIGLWFGPVRETLAFGQVNAILMLLVVVDVIKGRHRWWGGSLVGLTIAIKLTPAVFLLLFVLRKDWRGAITTVVSFIIYTGIGHLLMPRDSLQYWSRTLADTDRIGGLAYASNQSINAVLYRLGLDGTARTLAWLVVATVVGLLIAWVAGRLLTYGHDTAATISVGFVALFCSPVSWGHHWVWTLPLVVLMLVWAARSDTNRRWWLWLAGTGAAVFVARPQLWLPHSRDAELQWSPLQHFVGNSYLVWSLAALLVMGVFAHRLGRADTNAVTPPTVLWPALFSRRPAR